MSRPLSAICFCSLFSVFLVMPVTLQAQNFTREAFIRRDANVDGQLSSTEYLLNRRDLDLEFARVHFQEIDVDESQSLSLQEYVGFDPQSNLSEIEREVFRMTNEQRALEGIAPVKISRILSSYARDWTAQMVKQLDTNHGVKGTESYASARRTAAAKDMDLYYWGGSENVSRKTIEKDAPSQQIAQRAINGWMESEGHRKNLMNPEQEFIGIGAMWSQADGKYYFTQMYIKYPK
ncbi:CAP domain-containing protein [Rubinisphaera italica]|uniref:Cysteine-rich secretory protein family protein n=1 Tax=Rubinisphaera italica TaxID=2527969 RepID=A0A5C5XCG5_9PLAN|nr:CAP domain-containing protein [Rubinisphaera italica]TWT60736.1 Cysteine-rich secretory protein family protein [Rubinisphaera italica]